jgi:hypothetical protein
VLYRIKIYGVGRSIRFSVFLFMVKMVEGDGQPAATVSATLKKVCSILIVPDPAFNPDPNP